MKFKKLKSGDKFLTNGNKVMVVTKVYEDNYWSAYDTEEFEKEFSSSVYSLDLTNGKNKSEDYPLQGKMVLTPEKNPEYYV